MSDEVRRLRATFRTAPEKGEGVVVGYVTTYGNDYNIGWGLKERIDPHAFDESVSGQDSLPIFFEHDWALDSLVGTTSKATSDDTGLLLETQLFMDDPAARKLWQAMDRGALREWSIGFIARDVGYPEEEPDVEVINRGELLEASVVVKGANPETKTVLVRTGKFKELRELAAGAAERLRAAAEDADDDPASIAEAVDAANDALGEALDAGDIETAAALSTAVDIAVDRLIELLGGSDPDDDDGADDYALMSSSWGRELLRPTVTV